MRHTLLIALALSGCGAHQTENLRFELSATRRALQTELAVPVGWGEAAPVYVDEDGARVTPPAPEEVPPPIPAEAVAAQAPQEVVPEAPLPAVRDLDRWSALSLPAGRVSGGSELALLNLSRALDEHRQTLTLEARLADKQRLIDALSADVSELKTASVRAAPPGQAERQGLLQEVKEGREALAAAATARAEAEAREAAALREAEEAKQALAEAGTRTADEVAQLQGALQEAQTRQAALATESAAERQRLSKQLADQAAEQARLEAALQEIAGQQRQQSQAEREDAAWERRRQARKDRWERVVTRLSSKEKRAALEAEAEASRKEAVTAKAESEALRRQLAALQLRADALQRQGDALSAERSLLQSRQAQLEGEVAASTQARAAAQWRVAELQRAQEEQGALDEVRTAELRALQEQVAVMDLKEQEISELKGEVQRLAGKEAELADTQVALAELEGQAQRAEALEARLKAIADQEAAQRDQWEASMAPLVSLGFQVSYDAQGAQVYLPTDILFASGSAALSPAGKAKVRELAGPLAPQRTLHVQVEGHTDDVPVASGPYASNWDLAYARARAVLVELTAAGVPAEHLSATSYGETRPVQSNNTSEGRAANRRIAIALSIVGE
ncbi:MAG: OmpA family protein [Deltaproteobacteria bacterium]|nr:OmpA family protein [Deltaproteobacteria bacterium]